MMKKPLGRNGADLKKQLNSDIKTIRKKYREVVFTENSGVDEWIRDNGYLLCREAELIKKSIKYMPRQKSKAKSEDGLYRLCERAVLRDEELEKALIYELRAGKAYETTELDFLETLIKCCIISFAAKGIRENSLKYTERAVLRLRETDSVLFERLAADFSESEKTLRKDPAGIYGDMSDETKRLYRHECCRQANLCNMTETDYAVRLLNKAENAADERSRHIGTALFENNVLLKSHRIRGIIHLVMMLILPAVASVAFGFIFESAWLGIITFLPLRETVRPLLESLSTKGVKPQRLPCMNFGHSVPEEYKTVIAVSCLMPVAGKEKDLCTHLENLYRRNSSGSTLFALLADFKEAELPEMPGDSQAVAAVSRRINKLNSLYGERFFLLVRKRVPINTQGKYAAFERKRGAISELSELLSGKESEYAYTAGNIKILSGARYILALDSDTEVPMDTAGKLVEYAAHPLNRPAVDKSGKRVARGFGIIAPKIETALKSSTSSRFALITGGIGGVTAYDALCGNMYQDLFGQGVFSGKGLIDVAAFEQCMKNAFLPEKILSHDVLEGFYLKTASVTAIEVLDGTPEKASGFIARQKRWIRGDVQNLRMIFPVIKTPVGKIKNPLNGLSVYHLIDSVLREISAVFAGVMLVTAFFQPQNELMLVSTAANAVCAGALFAVFCDILYGGFSAILRRYYSRVLPECWLSLTRALLQIVMLIRSACFSALSILKALWRMTVSKRKLLEWTAAADADAGSFGLLNYIACDIPSLVFGIFAVLFGNAPLKIIGVAVFLCPFLLFFLSLPRKEREPSLSLKDTDRIRGWCAQMWDYFDKHINERNNWLIPDNVQLSPVYSVAHRTSPTNIGLMLLAVVAAQRLELISLDKMIFLLEKSIGSVEKLEKHEKGFYNWYDTETLMPLYPRFCSVVDIGNLACCLAALAHFLRLKSSETIRAAALAERVAKLENSIELAPFYDERRGLFSIGYDVEKQRFSKSYYDLLMSESRLTGYFAVSKRQVPEKHWSMLSRTLVRCGAFAGPVSWTGTMFEYFLPALLLDVYDNTLFSESLGFCLHAQRRRAKTKALPYGCSESCFYAFDAQFNYQYKAHGVQRLGLKRGLNDEYVVSPYSSFLTLPFFPGASMKNLDRLCKMGLNGVYGFYEAVDFTPSRCGRAPYAIVRGFMAHHTSMSLCSAVNTLYPGFFQGLFMQGDMLTASHLLEEKIPAGQTVYLNADRRSSPEKLRAYTHSEELDDIQPTVSKAHVLSNGEITSVLSDCGALNVFCRSLSLFRTSGDLLKRPAGVYLFIRSGKEAFFVTRAPDYSDKLSHRAEFKHTSAAFYAVGKTVSAGMSVAVHPSRNCIFFDLLVRNNSSRHISATLRFYAEPLMCSAAEEKSHPAFAHIFNVGEYNRDLNIITFTRKRKGDSPAAAEAFGFLEPHDFNFRLDRTKALIASEGTVSLKQTPASKGGNTVSLPDGCVDISFDVMLSPKAEKSFRMVVSFASDKREAETEIVRCRNEGMLSLSKCAVSPLFDSGLESRIASFLIPCIFYGSAENGKSRRKPVNAEASSRQLLWGQGISGDNPVVLMLVKGDYDLETAESYISIHSRLRKCGIKFELCIITDDSGEYERPLYSAVIRSIHTLSDDCLLAADNGIFLLERSTVSESTVSALMKAAVFTVPDNPSRILRIPDVFSPQELSRVAPEKTEPKGFAVKNGVFAGGVFTVTEKPKTVWSHVISKRNFGTLVSNSALGFTYYGNSREMRLTPFINDTTFDNRGELLLLKTDEGVYDLVNGATCEFSDQRAVYSGTAGSLRFKVSAGLSDENDAKLIECEFLNVKNVLNTELIFCCDPCLGDYADKHGQFEIYSPADGVLAAENPFMMPGYSGVMYLGCSEPVRFLTDRAAVICGDYSGKVSVNSPFQCAGLCAALPELNAGKTSKVRFVLGFCEKSDCALQCKTALSSPFYRTKHKNSFKINTPDKPLNILFNDWLMYQTENARLNARAGFYQASGAYGFRDQLQDACAEVLAEPQRAREHILLCCHRQFEEGDVMHWWHERNTGASGIRTRCSDDMLWLVWAVCDYINVTGDGSLLFENAPYLQAPELDINEKERYFSPPQTLYSESVLAHCKKSLSRVSYGSHSLLLIGSCDWNDGFSAVGCDGKGESVWLTQFYSMVCKRFADILLRYSAEKDYAGSLLEKSVAALESARNMYEGDRFLRAFFDDGSAIGSADSPEAKLDILSQSFAVLAAEKPGEKELTAMKTALKELVDNKNGIISLLLPAFDSVDAGYISSYPAGIRENGGQYTHAAVWFIKALLKCGMADEAIKLLRFVNPVSRSSTPELCESYITEPYALAADIYNRDGIKGRGGWTQYTGAAGWLYTTVLYDLLGIRLRYGNIYFEPCLPGTFDGYTADIHFEGCEIKVTVKRGNENTAFIDGEKKEYLVPDGKAHRAEVMFCKDDRSCGA